MLFLSNSHSQTQSVMACAIKTIVFSDGPFCLYDIGANSHYVMPSEDRRDLQPAVGIDTIAITSKVISNLSD